MKKVVINEKVFIVFIAILFLVIFGIFGFLIFSSINPKIKDREIIRNLSEGSSVKIEVNTYISDGKKLVPLDEYYKGYKVYGHINIPKTDVDLPILEDITVDGMRIAPCLVYRTAEGLNRVGMNFIEGHNFVDGTQFSNNGKLEVGDKIYITSMEGIMKEYEIYDKFITDPDDASYLQYDIEDDCDVILQTCTNNGKQRIIILSRMVN